MERKLWYMNSDFEMELSAPPGRYRRSPSFEDFNKRMATHLLWLTEPDDALLIEEPWPESLIDKAQSCGVELIAPNKRLEESELLFTPWGWTKSVIELGRSIGVDMYPVSTEIVARVNSKLFSHALEIELGIALPGADTASSFEELEKIVASACPIEKDKWVIKVPFGVASRGRVLGQGPVIKSSYAVWAKRQLAKGETLIFQPWLEVIREYGVNIYILPTGEIKLIGISDLQTNLAGTGKGYLLGRPPSKKRREELESFALIVGNRLFKEGYTGPAGFDALEHKGGFHPLLEINARYTMGFIAIAVERALRPNEPTFWSTK
jgi:hypothetical protein